MKEGGIHDETRPLRTVRTMGNLSDWPASRQYQTQKGTHCL